MSYDGRGFVGSQRQSNARTVQGELERALEEIAGKAIPIHLAGRTDRGVHAAGQVASCSREGLRLDVARLPKAMNAHLGRDIAVLEANLEPKGFHARYSATWREYRYRIWAGIRQPNAEGYVWGFPQPLDLVRMADAANRIVGEHDFAAFASGAKAFPGRAAKTASMDRLASCRFARSKSSRTGGALPGRDGSLIDISDRGKRVPATDGPRNRWNPDRNWAGRPPAGIGGRALRRQRPAFSAKERSRRRVDPLGGRIRKRTARGRKPGSYEAGAEPES